MKIFAVLSVFCILLGGANATRGDLVTATYRVTADDFYDSNNNSPPLPASNAVDGVYSFTFDTSKPIQKDILPHSVIGLDITGRNGVTTDYDETNSGVTTFLNTYTNVGRLTIGGMESTAEYMVGLSNDFIVIFEIDLTNYEVTSVIGNLSYVTTADPFYDSHNTTVQLESYSVAEPRFGFLLLGAVGVVFVRRRLKCKVPRRRRCGFDDIGGVGINRPGTVATTALTTAALIVSTAVTGTAFGQDSFQGLGDLSGGTSSSSARDLSADGTTVVGLGQSSSGAEGFRWTASTGMVALGDLSGGPFFSLARGVSSNGTLVAGYSISTSGPEAFRWAQPIGMVGLGDLPGGSFSSKANDVAGSVIVGHSDSASGIEAFRWSSFNGMVGLGDLSGGIFESSAAAISSDTSTIVGVSTSANGAEAFRWDSANGMVGLGDLAGSSFLSRAKGVSNDGSTIVGHSDSFNGLEAFRWSSDSGMVGLGDLSGGTFESNANAVSGDGAIVVGYGKNDQGFQGTIWDPQQGMRSIQKVLKEDIGLNVNGWRLFEAIAISADGLTIAGNGINPNGDSEAWVAHADAKWISEATGSWDDRSNWALGINPNELHDLQIAPQFGVTVSGPSTNATIKSLSIDAVAGVATLNVQAGIISVLQGTTIGTGGRLTGISGSVFSNSGGLTNQGVIDLGTNSLQLVSDTIDNSGLITGNGQIFGQVVNQADGQIRVQAGEHMQIAGSGLGNFGLVDVVGGTLEVTDQAFNAPSTGLVYARNATLRFNGGLKNEGSLGISFGTSDVHGDIENAASGIINVSGGAQATFVDDLKQEGLFQVVSVGNSTSTAVIFGAFSGIGGFTGGGDVYALGDLRPGASPGSVLYDGNLLLGAGTDTFLELGGTALGEFDQLVVTGDLSLAGDLFVELIDGHQLRLNEQYLVGDITGALTGEFFGLSEGDLVGNLGGQDLFISYLAGDGNDIALFTAVSEPSGAVLSLMGAAFGAVLFKRRRKRIRCDGARCDRV